VTEVAEDDTVLLDVDADGVATFTLNRPEHRNGWTPQLEQRYFHLLDEADRDPRVRVGVLTGAGKTFCPGVDSGRLDAVAGRPMDQTGRRSPATPWGFRKPLVAAINGACAGIGLVQALMCDVRFAARGAKFTTAFARRGLAAEFGAAWLLPRLVGTGVAADLLLSGRVVDADEAQSLGLVNRVVEPGDLLAVTRQYASDMARNCSPTSMALIRHQLHADVQMDFLSALEGTYRAMGYAATWPDFREGIDSFLEKRAPDFAPLADDFDPRAITGWPAAEPDFRPGDVTPLA
jgi:enoyl-CoA hydratase/carnithine racemase